MPPRVSEELNLIGVDSTEAFVKVLEDNLALDVVTGSPITIGMTPAVATGTTAVVPDILAGIGCVRGFPTSKTSTEGG
jgi:hypothetical protein